MNHCPGCTGWIKKFDEDGNTRIVRACSGCGHEAKIVALEQERDALLSQASAAATWIAGEPTEISSISQVLSVLQHTLRIAQEKRNREVELDAQLHAVQAERDALRKRVEDLTHRLNLANDRASRLEWPDRSGQ